MAAREPRAGALARVKDALRRGAHAVLAPLVSALQRLGLKADHVTLLGFGLSLVSGLAFFEGEFRQGALFAALAGVCDILDGELARRRAVPSRFGAFLDSTLDRLGESFILLGISGFYVAHLVDLALDPSSVMMEVSRGLEPRTWAALAITAVLALVGSFMVSYTRARAEGLGIECKVGFFERPERLVLIIVAGAFGVGRVMAIALLLLALMSFATAAQRVAHVWKHTRKTGRDR